MEPIAIQQCVIGSCTNGRIETSAAAKILAGRKRCKGALYCDSGHAGYLSVQAIKEGLPRSLLRPGYFQYADLWALLGRPMGVPAKGERAISTAGNRNFVGRMGHVESEVYLASPAVAAASAVAGYTTDPDKI